MLTQIYNSPYYISEPAFFVINVPIIYVFKMRTTCFHWTFRKQYAMGNTLTCTHNVCWTRYQWSWNNKGYHTPVWNGCLKKLATRRPNCEYLVPVWSSGPWLDMTWPLHMKWPYTYIFFLLEYYYNALQLVLVIAWVCGQLKVNGDLKM